MGKLRTKWITWFKQVKQKNGLSRDPIWLRWLGRWLLMSLALHLIAVASSTGFYHVDEHFQVVEPLSYKLEKTDFASLPQEFQNRTAPWLQSWTYFQIIQFAEKIGVENPLQWSLGFRLWNALFAWLAQVLLTLCLVQWQSSKPLRRLTVVAFALFWSLPAFHARHSSENLGGALFLSGLAFWVLTSKAKLNPWIWMITGLLMGFATQVHYSLVLCTLGFLAWLVHTNRSVFQKRTRALEFLRSLGVWAAGFALTVFVAFLADSWGYGEWIYSGWENLAQLPTYLAGWTPTALWKPLTDALTHSWPIWGLITYALLMVGPWVMRQNPVAWIATPLLVWIHLTPDHDLHELFPLVHLAPLFLVQVTEYCVTRYHWNVPRLQRLLKRKAARRTAIGLAAWYAVSFLSTTLLPAWAPAHFYSKLYAFRGYALNIHFLGGDGPFESLGLAMHFYRPQNVIGTQISDYAAFATKLEDTGSAGWLFHRHASLPQEAGELSQWCSLEISTLPASIEGARRVLLPHSQNWSLYRCKAPERSFASREKWAAPRPTREPASTTPTPPAAAVPQATPPSPAAPAQEDDDPEFSDPEFSPANLNPSLSRSSI